MYNIAVLTCSQYIYKEINKNIIEIKNESLYKDTSIEIYDKTEDICRSMKSGCVFDFIFIDLDMVMEEDFRIGSYIRFNLMNEKTKLIYIYSEDFDINELLKVNAFYCIKYPVIAEDIMEVFRLHNEEIKKSYLLVKVGSERVRINYTDIFYFESVGRKIKAFTTTGEYDFYSNVKELLFYLPKNFIQSHRSFVINIDKTKCIGTNYIIMQNNKKIMIGRYYKSNLKNIGI